MYRVEKTMEIAGAHRLNLPYASKCCNYHGHNWLVTVTAEADELDDNGMVVDFTEVKRRVEDKLDHQDLNEVLRNEGLRYGQPTAENIARWICEQHPLFTKVTVQESSGNVATYWKTL